jgi:hypothetical protein
VRGGTNAAATWKPCSPPVLLPPAQPIRPIACYQRELHPVGRHIPPSESIWNKARERRKTTPPRVQFANVRFKPCSQFAEINAKYYRKWRYPKPRPNAYPADSNLPLHPFSHISSPTRDFENSSPGPVRTTCHRFCLVGVPQLAQLKTPNPTGGEGCGMNGVSTSRYISTWQI